MKILVLAGGDSTEREVSLASGRAIYNSLVRLGHDVTAIDPASGKSLLTGGGKYILVEDRESVSKIALKPVDGTALVKTINTGDYNDIDLVFLGLHGGSGEDGTIQALLELTGKRYTGSNMLSSALAMNKAMAKKILSADNIPMPDWLLVRQAENKGLSSHVESILKRFSVPLIVKPNNGGSTVGLSLVKESSLLEKALEIAFKIGPDVLIEQYIKGREITAAVLDGKVLPLVEIVPSNELYDYQCKYTKGKSIYICPAKIESDTADRIRSHAEKAFEVLDCRGVVRVDFILGERNIPYFLEVNTLPGMTELSLVPMAAAEAGISFDELMKKICDLAI